MSRIVTVTSPASDHDYVQLATVKTELGISGSGSDTKLQRLIDAFGAEFSGADGLQREGWFQTYLMRIAGQGGIFLRVPQWPLVNISSITQGTGSTPTTVTATDYSIAGPDRDRVYRVDGWLDDTDREPTLEYNVTARAGWLMPAQAPAVWVTATAYSSGDLVKPTSGFLPGHLVMECTTAGTSDSSEPTWPTSEDGTVTDNTAVWTARVLRVVPQDIQEVALLTVMEWFRGGASVPAGIKREKDEGFEVEYFEGAMAGRLPPYARHVAERYR